MYNPLTHSEICSTLVELFGPPCDIFTGSDFDIDEFKKGYCHKLKSCSDSPNASCWYAFLSFVHSHIDQ